MGEFLGVEQPTVFRLENGRDESGPESRLLDLLQSAVESGEIAMGSSPFDALKVIGVPSQGPSLAESAGEAL